MTKKVVSFFRKNRGDTLSCRPVVKPTLNPSDATGQYTDDLQKRFMTLRSFCSKFIKVLFK